MNLKANELQDTVVSQKVFGRFDYLTFSILSLIIYSASAYLLVKWFSSGDWLIYPYTFSLLTAVLIVKLGVSQLRWWVLPFMTKPLPMPVRPGLKVGVATTFVPGAEPIEMLEKTVKALIEMDYPHDTWVLDEGDDPEVRDLCLRLGAFHFSRKNFPQYQTETGAFQTRSKHGNYNSWFQEIGFEKYEIITNFDPDHVPETSFLSETLGYFHDPTVGYVQSAQVYYNQKASFIARGAAEETYTYYSSAQMFCYTMGYPIVTGCHCSHRTSALRRVGGFPAHDAEDLYITMLYRASGWKGVYVPKILARGLTPVDWNGYFKQQLRWARSVLDIKFRVHPKLFKELPPKEIITSFLHGFYYLQGITTLIVLLVLSYILATQTIPKGVDYIMSPNAFLVIGLLTLCDFYRQRYYLDRKNEWGLHWRAHLLQFAKYPYLVFALFDVILNRRVPYILTSKVKETAQNNKLFLPHLIVAAIVCYGLVTGVLLGHRFHPVLYGVAVFSILLTLVLVATAYIKFPDPYNPVLLPQTETAKRTGRFLKKKKRDLNAFTSAAEAESSSRSRNV